MRPPALTGLPLRDEAPQAWDRGDGHHDRQGQVEATLVQHLDGGRDPGALGGGLPGDGVGLVVGEQQVRPERQDAADPDQRGEVRLADVL